MMQEQSEKDSAQPGLGDLITLSQAADYSEFSTSHLRLLVSRGEMWGVKLGGTWFTTIQAIEVYLRQGRKPGPKPGSKR